MHNTQQKLLDLQKHTDISGLSYREIGRLIGVKSAQLVKHHLNQLRKLNISEIKLPKINSLNDTGHLEEITFNIPVLGYARCGAPTTLANEMDLGYITVSTSLVTKRPGLFALVAVGNSMNLAQIKGNSLEDGDYAIIDSEKQTPNNGEYIVSIINGGANIKKFSQDRVNGNIVLSSISSEELAPIIIDPEDFSEYYVSGTVVQVVKKPSIN